MIVGLSGRMRVGKDAAASALVRDLGFQRVGFADKLKELAVEADPLVWAMEQPLNINLGAGGLAHEVRRLGWEGAKENRRVREFLQRLGTGARKVFGDDFWVNQALSAVSGNTVIPDVRFRNEAEAIRNAGGLLIRLNRPGGGGSLHASETDLDEWTDWDLVVNNDGSISDLEAQIVQFVTGRLRMTVKADAVPLD